MKSSKPRKQRKELLKGGFNRLKKEIKSHLSKSLKEKYSRRSFGIKTGDNVRIMRGKFKGKDGKVEKIITRTRKVYVEGIQKSKADGTFAKIGLAPSNLIITSLDLKDKLRKSKIENKIKKAPQKGATK